MDSATPHLFPDNRILLAALESSPSGIMVADRGGVIRWVNPAFTTMTGYTAREIVGHKPRPLQSVSQDSALCQALWSTLLAGESWRGELINRRKDGDLYMTEQTITPVTDDAGTITHFVCTQQEITKHGRSEARLEAASDYAENLIQAANAIMIVLDVEGRFRDSNRAAEEITGYTRAELENRDWFEQMVPINHYQEARAEFERMLAGGPPKLIEHPILTKSGEERYVIWQSSAVCEQGRIGGLIWLGIDISERKQAEDQLRHHALHDALTGLPNRALLLDRLEHRLRLAQRRSKPLFAVLFLDLDRFKAVNDTLGHAAGDQLLVEMARRLGSCLRAGDTLARWGGDEFVILLDDLPQPLLATVLAERIQKTLSVPVFLERQEVYPTASIGIVVSSSHYRQTEGEGMLRDADAAMFRAKTLGGGRWVVFDPEALSATIESPPAAWVVPSKEPTGPNTKSASASAAG